MPATRTSRAAAAAKAKTTKAAKKAAAEADAVQASPQADKAAGQEEDELQSSETDEGRRKDGKGEATASSSKNRDSIAEARAVPESEPDETASSEDAQIEGQNPDTEKQMETSKSGAEAESAATDGMEEAGKTDSHQARETRQTSVEQENSDDDADVDAFLKAGEPPRKGVHDIAEETPSKASKAEADKKTELQGADREEGLGVAQGGKAEKSEDAQDTPRKEKEDFAAFEETSNKAEADKEAGMQDAKQAESLPIEEQSRKNLPEDAHMSTDDISAEPRGTRRRRSQSPNGSVRGSRSPRRDTFEGEQAEGSQDRMFSEARAEELDQSREEGENSWKRDRRERKRPRLILDQSEVANVLERADRRTRRQRRGEADDDNAEDAEKERAAARAADENVDKEKSSQAESSTVATKESEPVKPAQEEKPKAGRRRAPGGMLGLLNSTLSKAREENNKRNSGDAAKRRADLESRLADKLKRESAAIQTVSTVDRALRSDKLNAFRLAEAIASGEAEHRSIRAQKRRLASFLVTKGIDSRTAITTAEAVREGEGSRDVKSLRRIAKLDRDELPLVSGLTKGKGAFISPDVPSSLPPVLDEATHGGFDRDAKPPEPGTVAANELATYPLYYLPKKLTVMQEDLLDDQEDEVDEEIEDADDAWAQKRRELEDELEKVLRGIRDATEKKVDVEAKAGLPIKLRVPFEDETFKDAREEAREAERHDDLPSPGGAKAD